MTIQDFIEDVLIEDGLYFSLVLTHYPIVKSHRKFGKCFQVINKEFDIIAGEGTSEVEARLTRLHMEMMKASYLRGELQIDPDADLLGAPPIGERH